MKLEYIIENNQHQFFSIKENRFLAFCHAVLNKLFGTSSITEQNIEIVIDCAIHNLDFIECTIGDLVDAKKIANEMQNLSPYNKQIEILQTKIDTKIVLLSKSMFATAETNNFTAQMIQSKIKKDITRASECFYQNQEFKEILPMKNYEEDFANISIEMQALCIAQCQEYEIQRNSISYLFNLTNGGQINVGMKREYVITESNSNKVSVSVKTSWYDKITKTDMVTVDSKITLDSSIMKEVFNRTPDNVKIINPKLSNDIINVNIIDQSLFERVML